MKSCEQTKNQSVLEHGISVKNYAFDIINHLEYGKPLKYDWKFPNWIYDNKDFIISNLPSKRTLKYYTILHDCGKPYCIKFDENGRKHFPDHANISYNIFSQLLTDKVAANLIKHDMDIHLLKSDGVDNFCLNPNAITLLLVGLAELHSNANMFGGLESTSFKIKWKNINKQGNKIINKLKTKN